MRGKHTCLCQVLGETGEDLKGTGQVRSFLMIWTERLLLSKSLDVNGSDFYVSFHSRRPLPPTVLGPHVRLRTLGIQAFQAYSIPIRMGSQKAYWALSLTRTGTSDTEVC